MSTLAAYIPFVHPLNIIHDWWYVLIIPLAFGIAVIYKAVRLHTLDHFWREVFVMTTQIMIAMIGLAIVVMGIVLLIPHMHVD